MPPRRARRTLFLAALSLVLSLALSDSSAEVSVFLEELSSAASDPFSVSVSLSCDCGQTKCNCLKVCECKLPAEVSGAQVRAGGSGPPLAAARPRRHKGNAAARGAGAAGGGAWQGSWQHEAGAGWQPASARELVTQLSQRLDTSAIDWAALRRDSSGGEVKPLPPTIQQVAMLSSATRMMRLL